jgi:putative ABC transport system permease protein
MLIRMLMGQLKRRPLVAGLHVLLIALGTAAMLLVAHISSLIAHHATREARNIDLVVGAKGSPTQLVLAGVYHLDVAPGNVPLSEVVALAQNPLVKSVIPLSLGDSYAGARIVGTTDAFLSHYAAAFTQGGLWTAPMDAVLGAEIAARTGLAVGTSFVGAHGLDDGGAGHADHPYMVTGILRPTGTVIDRLVLTQLESIWLTHHAAANAKPNETTLALLTYASPLAAASVPRAINATSTLQAASPALESARLLTIFGWVSDLLRGFAALVLGIAMLSIFATLSQALAERRYDLAVMRALGATRSLITRLLLTEALVFGCIGVCVGAVVSRVALLALRLWLPPDSPLHSSRIGQLATEEIGIIALVVVFSAMAALWPAWRAYRIDAGSELTKGR